MSFAAGIVGHADLTVGTLKHVVKLIEAGLGTIERLTVHLVYLLTRRVNGMLILLPRRTGFPIGATSLLGFSFRRRFPTPIFRAKPA